MEAIEFKAKAKLGTMIEIPEKYQKDISGEFRVIILLNKKKSEKKTPKREFKV